MESYFIELTGVGQSHVAKEEINVDNLAIDEVIIKNEYSMISAGTELSRAFALKKGFSYPVRPGYCSVGTVITDCEKLGLKVNDKVFVNCPHCSLVRYSCDNKTQGKSIMKLPEGIDLKEATIINLALVAIQGVNLADVKIGDTVAVFGLGNIGIITALMFEKLGCKVIGLDLVKERCSLAKEMGVKYICDSEKQEEYIKEFTNGKGADICVDVTGISPAIISAVNSTKQYGQVILLGSPRVDFQTNITPVFNRIHMKNLKVIGAFNQTAPVYPVEGSDNSVAKNFDIVCQLIMNKDIDVSKLIGEVIDPKDCQDAYYDLMYNKNKINCIIYDWHNY